MIDGIDPAMSEDEQQQVIDILVAAVVEWTVLSKHAPAPDCWTMALLGLLAREGFHVSREAA